MEKNDKLGFIEVLFQRTSEQKNVGACIARPLKRCIHRADDQWSPLQDLCKQGARSIKIGAVKAKEKQHKRPLARSAFGAFPKWLRELLLIRSVGIKDYICHFFSKKFCGGVGIGRTPRTSLAIGGYVRTDTPDCSPAAGGFSKAPPQKSRPFTDKSKFETQKEHDTAV